MYEGAELKVRQYSPAPSSVKGTETVSGLSQVRPGVAVGVEVFVGVGVGVAVGVGIILFPYGSFPILKITYAAVLYK